MSIERRAALSQHVCNQTCRSPRALCGKSAIIMIFFFLSLCGVGVPAEAARSFLQVKHTKDTQHNTTQQFPPELVSAALTH